jgi:uncharacterized membrane protein YdbT with pleckstrin-like domain
MGYIESSLLPGETIVARARCHWVLFAKPVAIVLIGLVAFVYQHVLGAVIVGVGVLVAVSPLITYATSEFGVTSKRVIIKVGFVKRRSLELLLRQIEAISVDQTVMGRLFGFGSITLTGTGGVHEVFHSIAKPLQFRRDVQAATLASGEIGGGV